MSAESEREQVSPSVRRAHRHGQCARRAIWLGLIGCTHKRPARFCVAFRSAQDCILTSGLSPFAPRKLFISSRTKSTFKTIRN
jgi:hypothetical protein